MVYARWWTALLFICSALPVTAQDICYVQQQLCNENCAGDTLCRIRTCFKEAVACQKRLDEQSQADPPAPLNESQNPRQQAAPSLPQAPAEMQPEPVVETPARVFRAPPRRSAPAKPQSYVLPPVDTCASLAWQGDRLIEFIATNNCPAAIDADVLFSDGTRVAVNCDGYDRCIVSFPKVQVSDQFQYWLRYATQSGDPQ